MSDDAQDERVLPAVSASAGDGRYELLFKEVWRPVLFDPCRPVHWAMRPAGAPPDREALPGEP